MTAPGFIPLAAPATPKPGATEAAFRVSVAPAAAGNLPFQPLSGAETAANSSFAQVHRPATAARPAPSVSLQHEGDRVTHIRIQCVCGEVILLECVY